MGVDALARILDELRSSEHADLGYGDHAEDCVSFLTIGPSGLGIESKCHTSLDDLDLFARPAWNVRGDAGEIVTVR